MSDYELPLMSQASPSGWNSDGIMTWESTQGNNAIAQINGITANSTPTLNFSSNWMVNELPTSNSNQDAVLKNIFYLTNTIHDIMYQFGFTEQGSD